MTALVWPFGTRVDGPNPGNDGSGQWRHIDQGQDLQAQGEEDILAVASGRVVYAHDPADAAHPGGHFGDPYPVLQLDTVVEGFPSVYYGHTHPVVPEGTRVKQGDKIAVTTSPGGGLAPDHWLEIGWWINGPAARGTGGWTAAGQKMHDALLAAPAWTPIPDPPPPKPHVDPSPPLPDPAPPVYGPVMEVDMQLQPVHFEVQIKGGDGWGQAAVPPGGRMVVPPYADEVDPRQAGTYVKVPAFAGIASDGVMDFGPGPFGPAPDGNYGFTMWVAAA